MQTSFLLKSGDQKKREEKGMRQKKLYEDFPETENTDLNLASQHPCHTHSKPLICGGFLGEAVRAVWQGSVLPIVSCRP
jgi:hypothetical protein